MKFLLQILIPLMLFTPFLKAQQSNILLIQIDSLEKQTAIFKENERVLTGFKANFDEKDSIMIIKFQELYKNYLEWLTKSDGLTENNKRRLDLEKEQRKIMAFEDSVNKADSVLNLEMKAWVKDFIKTKIRFYEISKNIKVVFLEKIDSDNTKIDFREIINFINDSNWKMAYDNQYNFIKNKVLFSFNLD